jgi:hypothetical protein
VAVAADGKRIFLGGKEGLFAAPTETFAFAKTSTAEVSCLAVTGTLLWACSNERSGFIVGSSRSGGKSFDAKLHFEDIQGPLECPPESSVAKECTTEWPLVRKELGLPEPGDKPRSAGSGGPAMRGRESRGGRARGGVAAAAGIVLFAYAAYSILQRLRRR